tara:strand:- start:430 stop:714 length:285 start_codon:yes stop_codon:yes gene_type:complete
MRHIYQTIFLVSIASIVYLGMGSNTRRVIDFIESEPQQVDQEIRMANAIDNIQDAMTWMNEDIQQGRIDSELGNIYLNNMNEAEDLLIEYIKNK